jgi:hypothetical protein
MPRTRHRTRGLLNQLHLVERVSKKCAYLTIVNCFAARVIAV